MNLTGSELALLLVHLALLAFNVMILLDALRARDSKPMLIDERMFKVVRPGDIAIVHFENPLSDLAYESFKKSLSKEPGICAEKVMLLDSCRSVLVIKLHEQADSGDKQAGDSNDRCDILRDKSGAAPQGLP